MNTWLFSSNDETFGPFNESEAQDFVVKNPLAYAWKPSFTHWVAVQSISEFASVIPAPTPPSTIPKELVASFYEKEKSIVEQLSVLDKRITLTNHSIVEFNKEITHYKRLTSSCNMEMQEMLDNIESQYARLKQNLQTISGDVLTDKKEHASLVSQFNDSVDASTVSNEEAPKEREVESLDVAPAIVEQKKTEQDVSIAEEVSVPPQVDVVNSAITEEISAHSESVKPEVEDVEIEVAEVEVAEVEAAETVEEVPVVEEVKVVVEVAEVAATVEKPSATLSPSLSVVEKNLEHTAAANQFSSVKPTQFKPVEYSESVSKEDISLSSRMRRVQLDEASAVSFDKAPMGEDCAGDFDYILKDKYADDGIAGARINKAESQDVVESEEESDESLKKRRRRRRR